MNRILLVDDEQNVLNALRRELRDAFEIEAFDDSVAALDHCRTTQFDLVVADYQMPGMNGLEFLKQFRLLQPDAARLLLSGESDINALIRTINETHVYRFIAKPWGKAELLSSIRQALSYRDALLERRRRLAAGPDGSVATQPPHDGATFHIVVADGDDSQLAIISSGLTSESGNEDIYGAIQQEMSNAPCPGKFKCAVEGFNTARAALGYAGEHHCDLVISAQTLPDMDGIQFLGKMRQLVPDAARILISEAPDKSMLSQAINEAEVKSLLQLQLQWVNYEMRSDARRQAWNMHQLKTAVIQALASRELLP
ncbi:MAG: hypothetical protein A2Z95_02800 [Gallionellales bacterium GWA2_60_18]|nr:MAG: hypothetical protein A2Z95_02800 [Gallionellales bacterium GWA2_60_18]